MAAAAGAGAAAGTAQAQTAQRRSRWALGCRQVAGPCGKPLLGRWPGALWPLARVQIIYNVLLMLRHWQVADIMAGLLGGGGGAGGAAHADTPGPEPSAGDDGWEDEDGDDLDTPLSLRYWGSRRWLALPWHSWGWPHCVGLHARVDH